MAGITKIDAVTGIFNGQSDIVIFPEVKDYSTATRASILTGGKSLGQIDGDTTEWAGEEASVETRVDEQGDVITVNPKKGTMGFKAVVASTSQAMIIELLKGEKITHSDSTAVGDMGAVTEITKFGDNLPVFTRPIGILNDEGTKLLLFPKAKIIASVSIKEKLLVVNITVTAEAVSTSELGTAMLFTGKATYSA